MLRARAPSAYDMDMSCGQMDMSCGQEDMMDISDEMDVSRSSTLCLSTLVYVMSDVPHNPQAKSGWPASSLTAFEHKRRLHMTSSTAGCVST